MKRIDSPLLTMVQIIQAMQPQMQGKRNVHG
jgi:hypothetical protein